MNRIDRYLIAAASIAARNGMQARGNFSSIMRRAHLRRVYPAPSNYSVLVATQGLTSFSIAKSVRLEWRISHSRWLRMGALKAWLLLRAVLLPKASLAIEKRTLQQVAVTKRSQKRSRLPVHDRVFLGWRVSGRFGSRRW